MALLTPCFFNHLRVFHNPMSQRLTPMLSCRYFIVLSFKFMICFELMFVWSVKYIYIFFAYPVILLPFVERTSLSSLHCTSSFVKIQLSICV